MHAAAGGGGQAAPARAAVRAARTRPRRTVRGARVTRGRPRPPPRRGRGPRALRVQAPGRPGHLALARRELRRRAAREEGEECEEQEEEEEAEAVTGLQGSRGIFVVARTLIGDSVERGYADLWS